MQGKRKLNRIFRDCEVLVLFKVKNEASTQIWISAKIMSEVIKYIGLNINPLIF